MILTRDTASLDPKLIACANAARQALAKRNLTIVTAEPYTGGLIAAALRAPSPAQTDRPLAEKVLARKGGVTATVAAQLAYGALMRSPADVALAVTGVFGPEPDADGTPIGAVYFCCCLRDGSLELLRKDFPPLGYGRLLALTVRTALDMIRATIDQPKQRTGVPRWFRAPEPAYFFNA